MKRNFTILITLLISISVFAQENSYWDAFPEKVKEKKSFRRLEEFYRKRAAPNDYIDLSTYRKEKAKVVTQLEKGLRSTVNWQEIGPNSLDYRWPDHWGECSGRVKTIAIDPTNEDIVYIGAAAGGLWKTTDGGETWVYKSEVYENNSFGAIAIDPNNTNVIYAGTGESLLGYNSTTYSGVGLYKSTDGGETWTNSNPFGDHTHFTDIQVHPSNSNLVFATLSHGLWYIGSTENEGVWMSTDAGENWTKAITSSNLESFDIEINPSTGYIFATVGGSSSNHGLYRSTDMGANWTKITNGLSSHTLSRAHLEFSTNNPNVGYMVYYSNSTRALKTTDGGSSWSYLPQTSQLGGTYDGFSWYDQGWYDLCIAVSPVDENVAFIGNVELHRTTNGSTFNPQRVNSQSNAWESVAHVDYHQVKYAPSNPNTIYVGSDGGISKSTDGGNTWFTANNGLKTIQFYRIASHPSNPNVLIGGAQDNGVFMTLDRGETPWYTVSTGDGMECVFDYSNPDIAYICTQYGSLTRITNNGANSDYITPNYPDTPTWTAPLIIHPNDSKTIYIASRYIFKSTNSGNSWTRITNSLTSDAINSLAQSSVNPDKMALSGSGSYSSNPEVMVSNDGGLSWNEVQNNIPDANRYISRVVFHPDEENTFYVVRSGYGSGKLYKTTDFGVTFENITNNLPDVPAQDLVIDPVNPDLMFIATDLGVYMSIDGGDNWQYENMGMPVIPIMDFDLYVNGETRILRVATHARSAYEAEIQDIVLPVELSSFTAGSVNGEVVLEWETATEVNNNGFEIERSIDNSSFTKIARVDGKGTTSERQYYRFTDNPTEETVYYRLRQLDFDGTYQLSKTVKVETGYVADFNLAQNYPNPFNPATKIVYSIPETGTVTLTITDPLGQQIKTLISEVKQSGRHEAMFNAAGLSSGLYFYTINFKSLSGEKTFSNTKKMLLLK